MLHAMLSALTVPEVAIDEAEAQKLAEATGKVARHYNIPGFDEKTQDWINLAICIGGLYGPRVVAYRLRIATSAPKPEPPIVQPAGAQNATSQPPAPQAAGIVTVQQPGLPPVNVRIN